ncbi:hypothetical protein [Methanohalophilus sp.]
MFSFTQSTYKHKDYIYERGQIAVDWSANADATSVEFYLDITDDMENFTGWIGPDGTVSSYYKGT